MGARVLEVGCGAAQCSRWLADRGVHAVGIDIAIAQLRHALPHLAPPHPSAPPRPTGSRRVSADRVRSDPTGSRSGPSNPDAIVSGRPEARREWAARCPGGNGHCAAVRRRDLRCGVRLVRGDPVRGGPPPAARRGPAGAATGWAVGVLRDPPDPVGVPGRPGSWPGSSASGSYFDRTPYVERDGSGAAVYAEFHRTIGDYVAALVGAGFVIETDRRARVAGLERRHVGRLEPPARNASARHPDHRVPGRWWCWRKAA